MHMEVDELDAEDGENAFFKLKKKDECLVDQDLRTK